MDRGIDHPEQIGPYRILQVLGEGGMGLVYEAEQLEPVRRRVALKVIKLGMDSKEVVARFEAERQALAVMSHPGIAQVLDGGLTEEGRPYFVMELVKGVPFTEYCDGREMSVRDRIALFIAVAHAVQHAHQKGVIHRDLKPSNILVTEHEGKPAIKVIDFGIAKAIAQPLTDKTLVTAYGMALGTLAYMSPEQAELSNLDIDTRSDVYALGVMLFEVLVGELPVDPSELGAVPFLAQLVGRVSDPARPSSRMTTTARARRQARMRGADSGQLRKLLRGDLDWIVLKAMEKDRARRYDTANALAMDLQRYLDGEPVLARSPSAGYRFRKFAGRNRVTVAAAAAVLLALVAGVVVSTTALTQARRDAATASQVSDFMTRLFAVSDPSEARGNSITARELLDSGAVRIQRELADQPLVRASLMLTMGRSYNSLGLPNPAEPLLDSAVAIREREMGPDHPAVAEALIALANVHNARGNDSTGQAMALRATAIYEAAHGPNALEVADALDAQAYYLGSQEQADRDARVIAIREAHLDPDDPLLARSYISSGWGLSFRGEPDSAVARFEAALAILSATDHPDQVGALEGLAGALSEIGQHEIALERYDEAIRVNDRFHEPHAPSSVGLRANKAIALARAGRFAEAEAIMLASVATTIEHRGPEANNLDWQLGMLGTMQMRQQKWVEAAATAGRQADLWERRGGGWAENVPETRAGQARTLVAAGRFAEARAILVPLLREFADAPQGWTAGAHHTMAGIQAATGNPSAASAEFARAAAMLRDQRETLLQSLRLGGIALPTPLVMAELLEDHAAVERQLGRSARADSLLADAATEREKLIEIAVGYRALQFPDTALIYLGRAAERGRAVLPESDQLLAVAMTETARTLQDRHDWEGAANAYRDLVDLAHTASPPDRGPAERAAVLLGRRARYVAALRRSDPASASDADEATGAAIDSIVRGGALEGEVPAGALNSICWWGSLAGHGRRVLQACDAAVATATEEERPRFLDSRAIARATSGDLDGAVADLEGYLAALPEGADDPVRRGWLEALQAGRSPFPRAVLDRMVLS